MEMEQEEEEEEKVRLFNLLVSQAINYLEIKGLYIYF